MLSESRNRLIVVGYYTTSEKRIGHKMPTGKLTFGPAFRPTVLPPRFLQHTSSTHPRAPRGKVPALETLEPRRNQRSKAAARARFSPSSSHLRGSPFMHHPPSPPAPRRFAQKLAREVPWPLLAARRRGGGVRRRGLDGPPDVRERRGSVAGAIEMVRRTFVDVWGPFDKARALWRRPPNAAGSHVNARVASAAREGCGGKRKTALNFGAWVGPGAEKMCTMRVLCARTGPRTVRFLAFASGAGLLSSRRGHGRSLAINCRVATRGLLRPASLRNDHLYCGAST